MTTDKAMSVPPSNSESSETLPVASHDLKQTFTHPLIKNGWFQEIESHQWPGQSLMLKVQSVLDARQSKYQDVLVFDSTHHGRVLVLDGAIQLTEKDECAYQECMAMVPLQCHPNPRRVCVIGGGDGGIVRECLKDPKVQHLTLCEIDEVVLEMAKTYFPSLSNGLSDPKVQVHIGDGIQFLKKCTPGSFDVIITDSSDFEGPAAQLYQLEYFQLLHSVLADQGLFCSQGECYWLHLDWLASTLGQLTSVFPSLAYAAMSVPTYPSGTIGLLLGSKLDNQLWESPQRPWSWSEEKSLFKFYNQQLHGSLFELPTFVLKALEEKKVALRPNKVLREKAKSGDSREN
ncbi:hypothetical protein HMI54_006302 [Coelomomyces lativittatus]|nr:hypothetical protein HMI55_004024 [Coelomomyces lativittatus]KAJ1515497.1 hypothetical protein HMI56_004181 [Coelomomyces lativittatus]KAJ1517278.1 hypothetical protein HMI54_006302 [Coelomomyces lativittatus]